MNTPFPYRASGRPYSERRESSWRAAGFSLVELVVVMTIVGILLAVIVPRFIGAKSGAYFREAVAVASVYQHAVAAYQVDHANSVPEFSAWGDKGVGPLNDLFSPPRPYVRGGAPEEVTSGRTALGTDAPSDGVALNFIRYVKTGTSTYYLALYSRSTTSDPFPSKARCALGNDLPSGIGSC